MSTDAKRRANAKYDETQEALRIRVPRGQKQLAKAHAATKGKSLNEYVNALIDADMTATAEAEGLTMDEYREKLVNPSKAD